MKYKTRLSLESQNKFGGMHTRGFGVSVDYGSMGSTYGEPGIDMKMSLSLAFWRWSLNFDAYWKDESG